jgi:predicted TIM-barrel fold metal-dependent hydrolase
MIIDAHCHIGRSGPVSLDVTWTPEQAVDNLKRHGIDRACCFTFWDNPDNGAVWEAARRHSQLIPFVLVDPKADRARERLEADLRRGFKGIKLHPQYHGYPLNNRTLADPIFELAEAHRVPVVCNGFGDNPFTMPGLFAEMADRFPRVNLVMFHSGFMWGRRDAEESARRRSNLFLGTTFVNPRGIRLGVDQIGPDKYIFEVDQPWWDAGVELLKIRRALDKDKDRELVLGGNMARLLGL